MRILAVADFHGNSSAESYLSKFLTQDFDCVVLIGDLTDFGPPEVAESLLELVKQTGVPCLAVPGNCDPKSILKVIDKYNMNLHGKCEELGGVKFVGLGGSNLTPFHTPFELNEVEIKEELAAASCDTNEKTVLVTHAPPFETKVDMIKSGTHVGSKSVRQYIEQKHPLVCLCGHVHEGREIDQLGRTLVVNPGPITKGFAAEVIINDKRKALAKLVEL